MILAINYLFPTTIESLNCTRRNSISTAEIIAFTAVSATNKVPLELGCGFPRPHVFTVPEVITLVPPYFYKYGVVV